MKAGWKWLSLTLLLCSCAQLPAGPSRLDSDLEVMKRRLERLEQKNTDSKSQSRSQQENLALQVAELQSGLDSLRVEFQSINGRLEDLGQGNRQLQEDISLIRDDLSLQVNHLTQQLEQLQQKTSTPARQKAETNTTMTPVVAPTQQPASKDLPKPEAQAQPPEQVYQQGLRLLREKKDFTGGRQQLQAFLGANAQHELAPNALYWIGESYYGEQAFDKAILTFQDVIEKYSDHPKAASAMLKQGLAFKQLGDLTSATTVWKRLRQTFPFSNEAQKAQELLK